MDAIHITITIASFFIETQITQDFQIFILNLEVNCSDKKNNMKLVFSV